MKRLFLAAIMVILAVQLLAGISHALTFPYVGSSSNPSFPPQTYQLEHSFYYWWEITDQKLADRLNKTIDTIKSAQFIFTGLQDLSGEPGNTLYFALANSLPTGTLVYYAGPTGNMVKYADNAQFQVNGVDASIYLDHVADPVSGTTPTTALSLGQWTDIYTSPVSHLDKIGPVRVSLNDYIPQLSGYVKDDAKFYIGFDPDCLWTYTNLTMTIETEVPEPGSLLLLGSGLAGLGLYSLRRKRIG